MKIYCATWFNTQFLVPQLTFEGLFILKFQAGEPRPNEATQTLIEH